MDQKQSQSVIRGIQKHVEKVLIAASGVAVLISGYVTLEYRSYTECQVRLQEASRATTLSFAQALQVLLAQPTRPVEERREAFVKLQETLDQQRTIQEKYGNCR